jgi:hypothetical protein
VTLRGAHLRGGIYRFANRENAPMVSKGQEARVRQCESLILRIPATSLGDANNLNKLLNGLHLFLAFFCRRDRAMAISYVRRAIRAERLSDSATPIYR